MLGLAQAVRVDGQSAPWRLPLLASLAEMAVVADVACAAGGPEAAGRSLGAKRPFVAEFPPARLCAAEALAGRTVSAAFALRGFAIGLAERAATGLARLARTLVARAALVAK